MNQGSVRAILIVIAAAALAGPLALSSRAAVAAALDPSPASSAWDALYRRYPQLLELERKLDTASARFYFGERDLSAAAANELLASIAGLRAASPDSALCDRLDYLEVRARSLLQRMSDDEIERESSPCLLAVIDSCARNNVVEEQIEIEFNDKTKYWIRYFQENGRKHFSRWLDRTGELGDVIEPILVEVGIPRDLLYLAVIESGLNLSARSYMNAVGPWQFMAGTAKLFGLRINWWLDERKDIVAATYAAANYLKYLHELFNSWPLALAAYNSGEHRVAYAITRQRTTDYWRLNLPTQTMMFVPKFMAALAIGRDPEAYGFPPPAEAPLEFDIVQVDRMTDLARISTIVGCPLKEIKDLNPHFKKPSTPPGMVVEVKVPKGLGDKCRAQLAASGGTGPQSFEPHTVKRGETLSQIAAQYGVTVAALRSFNDMGSTQKIRAGSILLVPGKDTGNAAVVASRPRYRYVAPPADAVSLPLLSASDGGGMMRYVVRKDDTLVKIAERFHTSLADLREWNGLTYDSVLHPGDTIKIARNSPGAPTAPGVRGSQARSGGGDGGAEASPRGSREPAADTWIVHVVKSGETLSSICRRYDVGVSDVLAWNDKVSRNKLYPGEKIKIKRKTG